MLNQTLQNSYRWALVVVGITVPLTAIYSLSVDFHPAIILLCLLTILLDLYPIHLPGGVQWTPSVICYIWSLHLFGLSETAIVVVISCLTIFASNYRLNLRSWRWNRFFVSLGMFQIALAICGLVKDVTNSSPELIQNAALVLCFEICNFCIYIGLYWSINQLPQARQGLKPFNLIPVGVSTAILVLVSEYENVLSAMLPASALLLCFIIMSRQHYRVVQSFTETNKKYQLIANHTDDMILVIDDKANISFASPSHVRLFHVSLDHIQGRPVFDFVESAEELRTAIAQTLPSASLLELTFRIGETEIPTETHVSPVFRENGELEGFIVVSRDISERLRQQQYLIQTEKLAVAGQLAAGIAHEIRNPLTSVMGFLQLLRNEFDALSPEAFRVVWSELTRISDITGQLLLLAKPEQAKFIDFDLKTIIRDTVTLLEGQAHKENVYFFAEMDQTAHIHCNPNQLKQVFLNIFKNSIEAMEGTGGNIYIHMMVVDNQARVQIRDEGPGIPAHLIQSLGQPFYTTKERGTGLGLMVVHNIVKEHTGTIRFTSDGASGTLVTICFPVVESEVNTPKRRAKQNSPS